MKVDKEEKLCRQRLRTSQDIIPNTVTKSLTQNLSRVLTLEKKAADCMQVTLGKEQRAVFSDHSQDKPTLKVWGRLKEDKCEGSLRALELEQGTYQVLGEGKRALRLLFLAKTICYLCGGHRPSWVDLLKVDFTLSHHLCAAPVTPCR